ncbi:type A2 lanthipeptide [Streptococcus caviae]|nr:type A2 lanthipeptide [Streptococcus sp. 'caviae']OLN84804.1 lantibiotic salivaricin A [Streptococcus sp. 'caviae']
MKDAKTLLETTIEEVSEQELKDTAGGRWYGWSFTITDECPNSVFVCC